MATPEFLKFLQGRVEQARLNFVHARTKLEVFEEHFGPLVYADGWQREAQRLSNQAHLAFEAYRKAWVECYSAANGVPLSEPRGVKLTEAGGAPVPTHAAIDLLQHKPSPAQETAAEMRALLDEMEGHLTEDLMQDLRLQVERAIEFHQEPEYARDLHSVAIKLQQLQ